MSVYMSGGLGETKSSPEEAFSKHKGEEDGWTKLRFRKLCKDKWTEVVLRSYDGDSVCMVLG